jgi:hypothetical protein
MKKQWDVFIAHSSGDAEIAIRLYDLLKDRIKVFLDLFCISPGDDWDTILKAAVVDSCIAVFIISPRSESAFYEREEIAISLSQSRKEPGDHKTIPLFVDGMQPSDNRVPYGFRIKQGLLLESYTELDQIAGQLVKLADDIASGMELPYEDLGETRQFSRPIRDYLKELHRDIEQLTQEQFRVIQQLRFVKRVTISGCAGSGKTLVAAEKAVRLAKAGLRVLFLCHNPLLAEYVHHLTAGTGVRVDDFCNWVAQLSAVPEAQRIAVWTHYDEPDSNTLQIARESLLASSQRYDSIIADEGQDFRNEWWTLVESALHDSAHSSFYIFYDNNQSLLPYRGAYPVEKLEIDLSRNCRNAGRVYDLMRCFDASSPEPEMRLRSRGEVRLMRYDINTETQRVKTTILESYKSGILNDTVILSGALDSLQSLPLAGLQIELPLVSPWQDEVRKQFEKVFHLYVPVGIRVPAGGDAWVADELNTLSSSAFPSDEDIQRVRSIAKKFRVQSNIRQKIIKSRIYRDAFHWSVTGGQIRLRRFQGPPIWAAEVVLHFQRHDWWQGIPKPDSITIVPYHEPRTEGTLPMYRVPDFKGLEADAIVLILRGVMPKNRESIYVGVSRARLNLWILADEAASSTLPKSFVWD